MAESKALAMDDGWLDGYAVAPKASAVEWVKDFAAEVDTALLDHLHVFPTQEGGLLVERQAGAHRWSLEVEPEADVYVVIVREGRPAECIEPADVAAATASFADFIREAR
jgi:hypothetical protein